jgi:hypothetical protein
MDYHGESGEGVPREMVETKSYALFVTHGGRRIPILCNGEDRGPYPSQENPMCYYGNVKELGKMVEGHLKRIRVTHNTDMDRLGTEVLFKHFDGSCLVEGTYLVDNWKKEHPDTTIMEEVLVARTATEGAARPPGAPEGAPLPPSEEDDEEELVDRRFAGRGGTSRSDASRILRSTAGRGAAGRGAVGRGAGRGPGRSTGGSSAY